MSRETQFIRKAGVASSTGDTLPADITDIVLRRIVILCLFFAGMTALGSTICIGNFLINGPQRCIATVLPRGSSS